MLCLRILHGVLYARPTHPRAGTTPLCLCLAGSLAELIHTAPNEIQTAPSLLPLHHPPFIEVIHARVACELQAREID